MSTTRIGNCTKYELRLRGVKVVSKKNRLKFGKGRAYKPTEVQDFEERLRSEGRTLLAEPLGGELSMEIEVTVPNRIRRDLQNFSDTIADALNGVLYQDDSQIFELRMRKRIGTEWDLIVRVKELED